MPTNFPEHSSERDLLISLDDLKRLFTNRKDMLDVFEEKLKQTPPIPVLMFYGVGGSGKTWMVYHLKENSCKTNNCPYAYINFRFNSTDPIECLREIRNQLHNINPQFRFPRFDIIWSVYWQRTNEGLQIIQSTFLPQDDVKRLENILQILSILPMGGQASAAIKSIVKFAGWVRDEHKAQKVLSWLQDHTAGDCYRQLNKMQFVQFPRLLALALAADLTDSSVNFEYRPIIFVDTYEYLEEKVKATDKTIIEELAEQFRLLETNIILLISGQNRLRWAEQLVGDHWELEADNIWAQEVEKNDHNKFISKYIEQYALGELSREDAFDYLINKRKLGNEEVCRKLYDLTRGYALALGTAADLLEDAGAKGTDKINELSGKLLDITETQNWRNTLNGMLLESLLGQLGEQGKEFLVGILRVASILRWFTEDLLLYIVGYNDLTFQDKFKRIIRYSFVEPHGVFAGESAYRIHPMMQDLLKQGIDNPTQKRFWQEKAHSYFKDKAASISAPENEEIAEIKSVYEIEQMFHAFEVNPAEAISLLEAHFNYNRKHFRWNNCSRLVEAAQSRTKLDPRTDSYVKFYEGELMMGFLPVNIADAFGLRFNEYTPNSYQEARETAITAYQDCINIQQESDDKSLIPLCLIRLGELLSLDTEAAPAVQKFVEALEISKTQNQKYLEAQALRHLAAFEHIENPYYGNKDYLQESLKLFRELDDKFWVAEMLKDLSIFYSKQEKFDEALPIAEEALTLAKQTNNANAIARAKHTFARALYYSKQYDKALSLYREAIEDFEEIGDVGGVTSCTRSVGMIMRDKNPPDYIEALKYLEKALEMDEKLKSVWGRARNHYEIAICCFRQELITQSLTEAEVARDLWKEIGHIDTQKAETLLSKIKSTPII
jgi:tetratricopeptide (TPR) repeat protein